MVWSVPDKSDLAGQSVEGQMIDSEHWTAPTCGVWVGVTLVAWKVGSDVLNVLKRSSASSLLKWSDHF